MGFLTPLVQRARRGDRDAFDELVRRTYHDMFNLARRYVGNDDDARDVVQEAYLRAYRGIRSFRGDARFTTWMHRITANCAHTFLERRSRHRHRYLDDAHPVADPCPDTDPELWAAGALLLRDIEDALRRLPERLRTILVLRDIYEVPHEEVAARLGITEGAAKVRLHRARHRLRDLLSNDEPATVTELPPPSGDPSVIARAG